MFDGPGIVVPALPQSATAVSAEGHHQAVATSHPLATQAADEALRAGGNAVDALVAASMMLAVVAPQSAGLGGGGVAMVRPGRGPPVREPPDLNEDPGAEPPRPSPPASGAGAPSRFYDFSDQLIDGEIAKPGSRVPRLDEDSRAFDFRAAIPRAGHPDRGAAVSQGQSVAVPGFVKGLWQMHKTYGKRPWRELVLPAARVAEVGFPVSRELAASLASRLPSLPPSTQAWLAPRGQVPRTGQWIRLPSLATTLRRVADLGPDALHRGSTAAAIVETVQQAGGGMTREDLANYSVDEGWSPQGLGIRPPGPRKWASQPWLSTWVLTGWPDADVLALPFDECEAATPTRWARALVHVVDRLAPSGGPEARPPPAAGASVAILDGAQMAAVAAFDLGQSLGSGLVPEDTGLLLNASLESPNRPVAGLLDASADGSQSPARAPLRFVLILGADGYGSGLGCQGPGLVAGKATLAVAATGAEATLEAVTLATLYPICAPASLEDGLALARVHRWGRPADALVEAGARHGDAMADALREKGLVVTRGPSTTRVQSVARTPDGFFQAASDPRGDGAVRVR